MKNAREMMDEILQMRKENKTYIVFDVNDDLEIVVESITYQNGEREISIELRNSETEEVYEASNNNYDNIEDIENSLVYIRTCAFDMLDDGR